VEYLEVRALLDRWACQEVQGGSESVAFEVAAGGRERSAVLGLLERGDDPDDRANQDIPEPQATWVTTADLVALGTPESRENLCLARAEQRVCRVNQGLLVCKAPWAILDFLGILDGVANRANRVCRELTASR